MNKLIELLKSKPTLKEVWVNEKGEWLTHSQKGFEKKTRSEILKDEKKP